jgi:hypothetical protein
MHINIKYIIKVSQVKVFISSLVIVFALFGCSKQTPIAPILVLANNSDYGTYTSEILKAEGFNDFVCDSLQNPKITPEYLKQFEIVILGETSVSKLNCEVLTDYVNSGGSLIAFRPDKILTGLFGINIDNESISGGYIAFDQNCEQCKGLSNAKLQFHGSADKYILKRGKTIATIFGEKAKTEGFPGIVINNYGKGLTVAFSYNLPKSIVYTRQGNPLFAGIEKDGIPGLRGMDLFTDGWFDASNSTINQADEQMALLSHCIEKLSADLKPLPHLWYFPDTLKCLVTLTNDGEYKTEKDFEPQFRDVDSMRAKMSIYIIGVDKVSKEWVDKWTSRGFEIAGHPDDTQEAGSPGWTRMDSVISSRKNEIKAKYGLAMRTNVNHWFVWCGRDVNGNQDFGAEARLEEKNGIELDINYAKYDIKSNQEQYFLGPPGTDQGNFTGSGLIMKFADVRGNTVNVYQHLNAVYDQEYNESHDPEGFFDCFRGLMDRSLQNEVYSFISIKSHNDEYYFSKVPLMRMLEYSNSNGVPVWTAIKLLDFVKMRDEASFTDIRWKDYKLSFILKSSLKHANGLTFMLPLKYGDRIIKSITRNDENATFIIRKVKGFDYAMVTVVPGTDYNIEAFYEK